MGKLADQIEASINADLDRAFREFVRLAVNDLPEVSPVYTGFFASSWKASKSRPRPQHDVENYEPWATIKQLKSTVKSYPGSISPRFDLPSFTRDDTIYIGNTARYARYALERPSQIVSYLAGLKSVAQTVFAAREGVTLKIAGSGTARGSKYQKVL